MPAAPPSVERLLNPTPLLGNTSQLHSVAFGRGRGGGDPRRKGTAVSEAWDDAELPELDDELELELDDDDDDAWDEEDDGDDED